MKFGVEKLAIGTVTGKEGGVIVELDCPCGCGSSLAKVLTPEGARRAAALLEKHAARSESLKTRIGAHRPDVAVLS